MQQTESTARKQSFENIIFPTKECPDARSCRYKIWDDKKRFIIIEAHTALEALRLSAVKNPICVEREMPVRWKILPNTMNSASDATVPNVTIPPEGDGALSSDEVAKLLNQ